ncbi:hypothetical protein EJ02DRAFT_466125 [Clathrospora elynae]|uniref:Uncharacterized protein n=1 Tax=Clathrospora elynae TaxID=706981 RepID=A0A6A5SQK4_9PLEO|nr:hypothetical protein EJ02DRAFT_466125 [Clathrospora elynae]
MESQRPPVQYSATSTQTNELPPNATTDGYDYSYNGKDSCQRQQSIRTERGSKSSYRRAHDSVISHPFSPKASSPPSPSSSISSIGRHHQSITEIQNARPEIKNQHIQLPQQAHLDPEKHGYGSSQGRRSPNRASAAGPEGDAIVYDQGEYQEKGPEEKAWHLLFYLCGPCAFLSGAIALWTVIALLASLVLAPLRFCTTTRPPLSEQITAFLAPALNLQLHLVYSHDSTTGYSAPMLVVVHLFSPVVAFGVAIAAWTAAGFWFFSSILGDPGGHDGHNDGKESILGVRNWWERWLSRGLRDSVAAA